MWNQELFPDQGMLWKTERKAGAGANLFLLNELFPTPLKIYHTIYHVPKEQVQWKAVIQW